MRTYIWTIPTRVFHWLLAIGFVAAYTLGDADDLRSLHYAFGAMVGGLLVFRLLFGFFGPKYSRFADFPATLKHQLSFLKNFFSGHKPYAGHNPPASVVMMLIILVGIACSLSGYIRYATENGLMTTGFGEDFAEETHEILANVFLGLVIAHLAGILAELIFHRKTGTVISIFTGYKNVEAGPARLNGLQKAFAVLWIVLPLLLFYKAYHFPVQAKETGNELREHHTQEKEHEEDDSH